MLKKLLIFFAIAIVLGVFVFNANGFAKKMVPQKTFTAPLAAPEVSIQGHEATYDITLISVKRGSKILDVEGQMLFKLQKACDGWKSTHNFDLNYDYVDRTSVKVKSKFTLFEDTNSETLAFHSTRTVDGGLTQDYTGHASKIKLSGEISDNLTNEIQKFTLPPDSYFPQEHTRKLLETAISDQKMVSMNVFDGSDEGTTNFINTFIHHTHTQKQAHPSTKLKNISQNSALKTPIDAALLKGQDWSVRLAFFPIKQVGGVASIFPDYEMSMTLEENGIISKMNVDYGDFSVIQTLKSLTPIAQEECR